jgi:predicted DNA-binding protein
MQPNLQPQKARINVQISSELKSKLSQISDYQGKKISTLVRESIEEKVNQIEKKIFKEKMKNAYQDLSDENLKISEDFKYSDADNL